MSDHAAAASGSRAGESLDVSLTLLNYLDAHDAQVLVDLLDAYARDPAGGAHPLSDFAKANLATCLAARPGAFTVLARVADRAAGLVNCMEGFSTFACQPLINIHDVVVLPEFRGCGIGQRMLEFVEQTARSRGACKLTLEVLQGNAPAQALYRRFGFASYALDPDWGVAQFMQKWLD